MILTLISSSLLAIAVPASAAYLVTLTNGETINAEDYSVNEWMIKLKLEGGSASFPRSLVASISAGVPMEKPLSDPSGPKAAAGPAARTIERAPMMRWQKAPPIINEPAPRDEDSQPGADDWGSGAGVRAERTTEEDMTVGEFLDRETEEGDDSIDDNRLTPEDFQGFEPEDAATGQQ